MRSNDVFRRGVARLVVVILAVAGGAVCLAGCTVRAGGVAGVVGAEAHLPTMLLATGIEGCDCTRAFLLPAPSPSLDRAIEAALAPIDEAVVLTEASVETSTLWTGVYNRQCACVRGSAAKVARQIVLPAPAGHHGAPPAGHHGAPPAGHHGAH